MIERFRLSVPERTSLGTWNVNVRRDGVRPAGGTASGPTPEKATAGAWEIVRDILQHEQSKGLHA